MFSFRVSPPVAWTYPSIELRTGNSWPCLIFDLDGSRAHAEAVSRMRSKDLPTANWVVQKSGGGSHAVYTLVSAVHRGAAARGRPLRLFARVSEWLTLELGADAGYAGVLTHNPVYQGPLSDLGTWWANPRPYDLATLAESIPPDFKLPTAPSSYVGRNCALFSACMEWAGRAANLGYDVLSVAELRNLDFNPPLDRKEVAGIAKSVERYRRRWEEQGRFYAPEEAREWGRRRGQISGRVPAPKGRGPRRGVGGGAHGRGQRRGAGGPAGPEWKSGGARPGQGSADVLPPGDAQALGSRGDKPFDVVSETARERWERDGIGRLRPSSGITPVKDSGPETARTSHRSGPPCPFPRAPGRISGPRGPGR